MGLLPTLDDVLPLALVPLDAGIWKSNLHQRAS